MDSTLVGLISLAFAMAVQIAGVSFVLGGLFQRVRSLEARARDLESGGENDGDRRTDLLVRFAELETTFKITNKTLTDEVAGVKREVHGLSRQMAAVTTRNRPGVIPPLGDALGNE